jgi:hypothetical protein
MCRRVQVFAIGTLDLQSAKEEVARLARVIEEKDKELQRLRDAIAKVEAECVQLRRDADSMKSLFIPSGDAARHDDDSGSDSDGSTVSRARSTRVGAAAGAGGILGGVTSLGGGRQGVVDPAKLWELFVKERQQCTILQDQVADQQRLRLAAETTTQKIRDKCEMMMKKFDEMQSKREVVVVHAPVHYCNCRFSWYFYGSAWVHVCVCMCVCICVLGGGVCEGSEPHLPHITFRQWLFEARLHSC